MFDLIDLAFDPHEARGPDGRWIKGVSEFEHALAGLGKRGTGVSAGTVEDPINCAGNVVLAAKLLAEGKHIRLNREAEVGTLLDRLAFLTQEAARKGKDAPNIDLCKVSVPKTNLFCAKTKGIPRKHMPQLSGVPVKGSKADALPRARGDEVDIIAQFRDELAKRGIKVTDESIPADHLKATQSELIGPKVAGIYEAMKAAPANSGLFERIMVTRDGYVIDGHHRWAAQVALEASKGTESAKMKMKVAMLDIEIGEALDLSKAFAADWGIPQQGFVLNKDPVPKELSTFYDFLDDLVDVDLARTEHVRTPAGVKKYHLPIGSLIVGHDDLHPVEAVSGWTSLKPGDTIPDTSTKGRAQWLDDAPVGTTIEVTPAHQARPSAVPGVVTYDEARGPRRIWTKVSSQSEPAPHWESSRPEGSTDMARKGQEVIDSQWGPAEYKIPPDFGGDIDKVLHPKDGDRISYTNGFDGPDAKPTTMVYDSSTGRFKGDIVSFEPRTLLGQIGVASGIIKVGDDKSAHDYLFWAADADHLDETFLRGATVPFEIPTGWTQLTPRQAFPEDTGMALSYYGRTHNSRELRLFRGTHGEVAVVDDVGQAKNLKPFLQGVDDAVHIARSAPAIKDPHMERDGTGMNALRHKYLTFTVPEVWDSAEDALAYVRGGLPDDVQVNTALVNGTYDTDNEIRALRISTTPYYSILQRLTAFKDYWDFKHDPTRNGKSYLKAPDQNWWGPASGMATDNIFTAALAHELGHVNDGRLGDTGEGGIDADPDAIQFYLHHLGLSQYARTNAAEGYAEAFAEYFFEQTLTDAQLKTIPVEIREIAAAYAVKYGWAPWDAELMVKE